MKEKHLFFVYLSLVLAASAGSLSWLLFFSQERTQEEPSPVVVGIVQPTAFLDPYVEGMKERMGELGYVEGEDIVYAYRLGSFDPSAENYIKRVTEEHLGSGVDILYVPAAPMLVWETVQELNSATPIVFAGAHAPLEEGVIESYSVPNTNATGVANNAAELVLKKLEFLTRLNPDARVIGIFGEGFKAEGVGEMVEEAFREQAVQFGFEIREYTTTVPASMAQEEFERVAAEIEPEEIDAIFHLPGHYHRYREEADLAIRLGIPNIAANEEEVRGGGLYAYAASYHDIGKEAAEYVHRIIQGEDPAVIPVAFPQNPRFSLNLETADAIGLEISDSIMGIVGQIFAEIEPINH